MPGSAVLPEPGTPYHHFLRTPRHHWWKSVVMVVSVVAAYFVLSLVMTTIALVVDAVTGRSTTFLDGTIEITPIMFAATTLGLALLIPVSMLLQWALWGQRPRWMSSVAGGLRWGLMARFALVLVPIYLVYIAIGTFGTGWRPGPELNPDWLVFTILIIVIIPFQAAGEEYAVRGALTRAIAAVIPPRLASFVIATLVSAAIFTAGHPNLDPGRLTVYLVIASGFSVLVWRTGGLEAAILGHALNNVLVMIPTALWGDMTDALLGVDG
ncbi:MAG TPA: CPBP family intramembrane metalloprotease, partial [Candidatus Avipropionibacterium avicola]|nr:CPBP family intramembrane metalloprotease [Candidatus Avipropionibacterium avicola]